MGWASGTQVAVDFITDPRVQLLEDKERKLVLEAMLEALQGHDWDCETDPFGIDWVYDEILKEKFPEWFDEDASVE